MKIRLLLITLLASALFSGCGTAAEADITPSPTVLTQAEITPYATTTPLVPDTPTPPTVPTKTPLPLPSPTPFLYTVEANDTMIGIASYFGITLDELMIANPDANPNTLSIGTQLIIPLEQDTEGEDGQIAAEPEVLPLETSPPACYPVRSGGLWCFWLVSNTTEQVAENIGGVIRLYNQQDEQAASKTATVLLNVLEPGENLPLAAYFAPPIPEWIEVQGQLTGAVAANRYEARYLTTTIDQLKIDEGEQNNQAVTVSGVLSYTVPEETSNAPDYAWVVAVAYNAEDTVVGVRRWEAEEVPAGGEIDFNFEIYSLGKPIEQVELLAEVPAALP